MLFIVIVLFFHELLMSLISQPFVLFFQNGILSVAFGLALLTLDTNLCLFVFSIKCVMARI